MRAMPHLPDCDLLLTTAEVVHASVARGRDLEIWNDATLEILSRVSESAQGPPQSCMD